MSTKNGSPIVALVVFDGLRPDLISEACTPNLHRFSADGTTFGNARSVFPSMTRVATTSIATGSMPSQHGVMGNSFYYPAASGGGYFDTGSLDRIIDAKRRLDGEVVTAPTFADAAARHGKKVCIVHTGSAGAAYCLNPRADNNSGWTFSIHGPESTLTPRAVEDVVALFGPLPKKEVPQFSQIKYATDVVVDYVLPMQQPDVLVLWYNEPDTTCHYHSFASSETDAILRYVDEQFGRVVDALRQYADEDRLTILVASDHGQIHIDQEVDLSGELRRSGYRPLGSSLGELDDCAIALTGWNVGEITSLTNSERDISNICRWLQSQDFIGSLFSAGEGREEGWLPGTLSFDLLGINHVRQPDIMYTLKNSTLPGPSGHLGITQVVKGVNAPVGGGMHGGLNRYELTSTLLACGPAFRAGSLDERASGIVDIAPTILDLLQVPVPKTMTGRTLVREDHVPARLQTFGVFTAGYEQVLLRASAGDAVYLQSAFSSV